MYGFDLIKSGLNAHENDGYLCDTEAFPALSNNGHDADISVSIAVGQKVYKLDWSDDKPGARALIEYMKIL